MAKITQAGEITGKSAKDIYVASQEALTAAGFEVWKKRPVAWLLMAKQKVEGQWVNANLAVRPTSPTSYALTISSDGLDEGSLQGFADVVTESLRELRQD
mgnify:CR=1 FL=1